MPARFRSSRAVGPILGLTPPLEPSGESQHVARMSLCGHGMMRDLLYEAAKAKLTWVKTWSWLRVWAAQSQGGAGSRKP
ncbi:transposase [Fluviibacterium sp. DFM31]|uniref:Transposase n=1 Tax=Meridianimarinicoccus marinus TaxID=3231483 RepID=A0ABV3L6L9_9RHOB